MSVWVYQDEPNPAKVDHVRSSFTQMIACFHRKTRHVTTLPVGQPETVNYEWYTTIFFKLSLKKSGKPTAEDKATMRVTRYLLSYSYPEIHIYIHKKQP